MAELQVITSDCFAMHLLTLQPSLLWLTHFCHVVSLGALNYTPVDPKQLFHIHVVILALDVGNFESISIGNSMDYKQHFFMYYCYLGGSMLV